MANDEDEDVKDGRDWFKKEFGKDFETFYLEHLAQQFKQSWSQQSHDECQWRLGYIEKMVLEKTKIISTHGIFGIGWCDRSIEAVIMGDMDKLRTAVSVLSLEVEVGTEEAPEQFTDFRAICLEVLATAGAQRGEKMKT